ncbi:MAG: hypothetical protein CM15mP125_3900 [Gammaproteobacteria bacterium]|nr:MAG: hypothetical protein CM15mP125_3900 [Gammaproteobacteria bacterium]
MPVKLASRGGGGSGPFPRVMCLGGFSAGFPKSGKKRGKKALIRSPSEPAVWRGAGPGGGARGKMTQSFRWGKGRVRVTVAGGFPADAVRVFSRAREHAGVYKRWHLACAHRTCPEAGRQ